jgi:hypothetical protein
MGMNAGARAAPGGRATPDLLTPATYSDRWSGKGGPCCNCPAGPVTPRERTRPDERAEHAERPGRAGAGYTWYAIQEASVRAAAR